MLGRTQYRLLYSLVRSKEVLRYYSVRSDLDLGGGESEKVSNHRKIIQNIGDCRLWDNIEDLLEILRKIHECQIISELSNVHLELVLQKWYDIENHLKNLRNHPGFARIGKIDTIF